MENTCLKHWPCGMLPRAFLKRLNSSQAKLENLQDIGRLTRQIDRRDVNELLLNMPECISWHHLMNDSVIGYNLSRIFTNCVYCEFRKTQARVACSPQRTQPAQIWSIIAGTCAFCTFAPQKTSSFCWGETDLDRGIKKNSPLNSSKTLDFHQSSSKMLPMSFLFNFHNWPIFFLKKSLDPNSSMTSWDQLWKWSKPWIHFHQSPRRPQRNKRTALVGFQNCSANSHSFFESSTLWTSFFKKKEHVYKISPNILPPSSSYHQFVRVYQHRST